MLPRIFGARERRSLSGIQPLKSSRRYWCGMWRSTGSPDIDAANPRFVAAESLLLSGLLLLGVYVLWDVGLVLEVQWPPRGHASG